MCTQKCAYTCIHTYTHMHMHTHMYTNICTYTHTNTHTHTHAHTHTRKCTHTYTNTITNSHMHTNIQAYAHKHTGIYTHACMHMRMCAHTRTHTERLYCLWNDWLYQLNMEFQYIHGAKYFDITKHLHGMINCVCLYMSHLTTVVCCNHRHSSYLDRMRCSIFYIRVGLIQALPNEKYKFRTD